MVSKILNVVYHHRIALCINKAPRTIETPHILKIYYIVHH